MDDKKRFTVIRRTKTGEVFRTDKEIEAPKTTVTQVKKKEHKPLVHVPGYVKRSGTIVNDYWYDNLHHAQEILDRQHGTTDPPMWSKDSVKYKPKKKEPSDKYRNYEHLKQHEQEGMDYSIEHQRKNDNLAVIAVHGGNTEPGTTETAKAIAGEHYNYYSMVSHKELDNSDLHVTSTSFDEPRAVDLVKNSIGVISIHGAKDAEKAVYIGGMHEDFKKRIQKSLEEHGFDVKTHSNPGLSGGGTTNIVNRGLLGAGVQLELSRGLREAFFSDGLLTRQVPTPEFHNFVNAITTEIKRMPNNLPKHIEIPKNV
jgi:phage replication-related protein YjqB (UPF0714/DUF867 family)